MKCNSISDYFLSIWAEEARWRGHLSGIHLGFWKFGQMRHYDFLFYSKEFIESECLLLSYLQYELIVRLCPSEVIFILLSINVSILRMISLKDLPNHEHLLLVKALVEVAMHSKGGVDCLRL